MKESINHNLSKENILFYDECRQLVQTNSFEARNIIYQRLLYSSQWADFILSILADNSIALPSATRELFESLDYERLRIERNARVKNLDRHFERNCPNLYFCYSKEKLTPVFQEFVNSRDFWLIKGRTLSENFCLYVYKALSKETEGFIQDVAMLNGIMSGIASLDGNIVSPWDTTMETNTVLFSTPVAIVESFSSRWQILDSKGMLPNEENLDYVSQENPQEILVVKTVRGNIVAVAVSKYD